MKLQQRQLSPPVQLHDIGSSSYRCFTVILEIIKCDPHHPASEAEEPQAQSTMKAFTGLSAMAALAALASVTNAETAAASNSSAPVADIQFHCSIPDIGAEWFWVGSYQTGPFQGCTTLNSNQLWGMLRAYREGGIENTHWKYTNDDNDPACLQDWFYLNKDGSVHDHIYGRTTRDSNGRKWCALPVYRTGGIQGREWQYCTCVPN